MHPPCNSPLESRCLLIFPIVSTLYDQFLYWVDASQLMNYENKHFLTKYIKEHV